MGASKRDTFRLGAAVKDTVGKLLAATSRSRFCAFAVFVASSVRARSSKFGTVVVRPLANIWVRAFAASFSSSCVTVAFCSVFQ